MYLIPAPAKLEKKEGQFIWTYETYVNLDKSCSLKVGRQAALFLDKAGELLGYRAQLSKGQEKPGDIVLVQDDGMKKQSYVLDITEQGVRLTGEESGLWHGMQTILQIAEQEGACLPCLHIEDAPAIENRGYYFDCARGRVPKLDWLKKLADRMAYYKMNQLQLYIEHSYLFRGMTELWRDDTPLTAEEIMEFDRYCAERGIELVPSLSSFGHLYKLLSSKEYAHLCELEGSDKQPMFSQSGRMAHHTLNATDPESLTLIEGMIGEYMELFSSRQFNFCADETFDLGKGRSKEAVEKLGRDRVYIDFIKELAKFVLANGRRPMFWGDIILGFPEMIKELPEEIICLNWGYMWNQREEETKWMYEAGAVQYCCPGCCSWNQISPLYWNAYNNIMRLCNYANKYGAIGLLNTDWGDYLHVNQPDLTRVGMIYGAAFSWNSQIPSYEEINRQISRIEYRDSSENILAVVARIQENAAFQWNETVRFWELKRGITEFEEQTKKFMKERLADMTELDGKDRCLQEIIRELYGQIAELDSSRRELVLLHIIAAQGVRLFNQVGKYVTAEMFGCTYETMPDRFALAKELETWLYYYKKEYRRVSEESELRRIQSLVCWYGDYLRQK
ncbi:MAG: glycoside hydrolase family 20 zincin-like fold domain-containing protein [Eubacteriales bacterium]|nr:glycoside hydrolase family 20 zincin-like fold domain-containing protein [Eubacteriales bacterium]